MTDNADLDNHNASNSATSENELSQEASSDLPRLLKQIDDLLSEVEVQKQNHLRAVADLDNYRRRAVREKNDLRLSITGSIVESLLPVVDNLQLGLNSASSHNESKDVINGFKMVLEQFQSVLKDHGVEALNPVNEAFDPNKHECIAHLPHDEIPEGQVIEVVRVGYAFQERLIRPANVVVSSGPKPLES